jgi:hypothetical protein
MTYEDLQKEMAQILRARRRERYIKRYIIGPLGVAILLLASLKIIDLLPSRSAGTVDISFSLECRRLEGDLYKNLMVDVTGYEKMAAEYERQYQQGDLKARDRFRDYRKIYNIADYETGVRLAVVHGVPDSSADTAMSGLRVVKATPELITLESPGKNQYGQIDRRTGHTEIIQYMPQDDEHKKYDKHLIEIRKQVKFECEPSKPAKF